jgi:hypothetical protein|tara:strand:+ start:114 stop:695 length:582 start_codon:yes stop_codon:yes gene_type:complete
MKPVVDFIIEPVGDRYNNIHKVGDKELILNTEMFNHEYVNRKGVVVATPFYNPNKLEVGDEVILHHNVFRRWHNVKGIEKNSRSFIEEGQYLVGSDQIFMYGKESKWVCMPGYTFVKPIESTDKFSLSKEKELIGVVKYSDGTHSKDKLIGFDPVSTYEFVVDGERLYRVMNKFITIEYEYRGNEKEYNPSWA